jgi:hypothetical protein
VSVQVSPISSATAALKRLVIERAITSFTTNFERRLEAGFVPHIIVTIVGQDELAIARAKRRVEAELRPVLGRVQIAVQPQAPSPEGRF